MCLKTTNNMPEPMTVPDLFDLSRKTGLVIKPIDSEGLSNLFAELENYNERERAETFEYLTRALNETRQSLGAEAAYLNE